MTPDRQRPLLFLDVDGTLLPFGDDPSGAGLGARTGSYLDRFTPQVGHGLAALPCDLIWATTWEQEANVELAPRLGLPSLPVVHWPEPTAEREREDQWFGLHWKTRPLAEWAAGRRFAWVDDEITDADREWVSTHCRDHALLHRVEPSRGLTVEDIAVLDLWLRGP
ncbi:hypothetical protein EV191_10465 [Tamaricihabitans halophyticus]|uniref:Secreted protein n=1 Tax=Tamaricihabitans halophyticus TaxID=1262583 RepID=A0A4R2QX06_9PSEU|nr:HAD domain-containing protein [Tamaricihabitans halophyticus]TCP53498.1 hypothetical protein EV191_10465 [Tamaricihabitans halophyticus]